MEPFTLTEYALATPLMRRLTGSTSNVIHLNKSGRAFALVRVTATAKPLHSFLQNRAGEELEKERRIRAPVTDREGWSGDTAPKQERGRELKMRRMSDAAPLYALMMVAAVVALFIGAWIAW